MVRSCVAIWLVLAGCQDEPSDVRASEAEIRAVPVELAEVIHDPTAYDGQTLRVIGENAGVRDGRVLALRGRGLLWAPKLAVVVRDEDLERIERIGRGEIIVIGTLRAAPTPEALRALAIAPALAGSLAGHPVLIARSIERGSA